MNKKSITMFSILLMLATFFLVSCSIGTTNKPQNSPTPQNAAFVTQFSLSEVLTAAYEESTLWRKGLVLTFISTNSSYLNDDWKNNERAEKWTVDFTNPKTFEISHLVYDKKLIESEERLKFPNKITFHDNFPKLKPGIGISDAAKVAVTAGAPDVKPFFAIYSINLDPFKSKPVWRFDYNISITNNSYEIHHYFVDGINGKFLQVIYEDSNGKTINR